MVGARQTGGGGGGGAELREDEAKGAEMEE